MPFNPFAPGAAQPATITPAAAPQPAFVEFLKSSGFLQPEPDPRDVQRQNIARALVKAGAAMSGNKGNFLQALSQSIGVGAEAYVDSADTEDAAKRARAQKLLSEYVDWNTTNRKMEQTQAIADAKFGQGEKRLSLLEADQQWKREHGDEVLGETTAHNRATEGQAAATLDETRRGRVATETRLDKGFTETQTHNRAIERQSAETLATTKAHNAKVEDFANQRITLARENGQRTLAARMEQQRISGMNAANGREGLRLQARKLVQEQFKILGLDKEMLPDERDAAMKEYESFKQGVLDELNANIGDEPDELKAGGPDPNGPLQRPRAKANGKTWEKQPDGRWKMID